MFAAVSACDPEGPLLHGRLFRRRFTHAKPGWLKKIRDAVSLSSTDLADY
jgi:hypothetical protein